MTACAVPPDGHRVVSASKDGTLKLWDLDEGRLLATFRGHTDVVTACAVTPDGQHVISASRDRTLKLWNLPSGRLLATFEGHTDAVTACAVLPDSRRVVSASRDGTLKLWSLDTQACLLTHRGDAPYTAVAATTAVIAGDDAGIVWVLDWPPSRNPTVRAAAWPSPPCALPAPVTATTRQRRQS
jgi:WD40 repeat protein